MGDHSEIAKNSTSIPMSESKQAGYRNQKEIDALKLQKSSGLRVRSIFKTWAEVSRINYVTSQALDTFHLQNETSSYKYSVEKQPKEHSLPVTLQKIHTDDMFYEKFPSNVTSLLNEDQHWGCFYTFPELYADVYSPVVRIRSIEDVPELLGGVLTRDVVTACLTYLKRTPILGDYVYIKLDLSYKMLQDIKVLQHYKYLVYLDLSANFLTELSVLSYLLYLQYLSVNSNRLNTVLEYDTPQWFLTEVHYMYNSVKTIRDLDMFWSITVLDLSHNNITAITGLDTLKYLRRLDLSFNHIKRLENLNHLRLLWLDVSYNNISSFEYGSTTGLRTLLHLEYLNINENNFTSMKMFSGCIRLRELYMRNNRLSMLLELAVYMRQMRRLITLDLRANPICSVPCYKDVVINTFPLLSRLDNVDLDPVAQRTSKMDMSPNINSFAIRRLLRLMYVEQLSRARVAPNAPPADTTEVPLVVLVGYEAVGKGTLARRLAAECSEHVDLALCHTTAPYHQTDKYNVIGRDQFDQMLVAGEFLTYSEMDGESYGLSRDEAFIRPGKVRIACMDLVGALMLRFRGRRPYLILATRSDKKDMLMRQQLRRSYRSEDIEKRAMKISTLQVMLSGRTLVACIINDIIAHLDDENDKNEFLVDSECSLMRGSESRLKAAKGIGPQRHSNFPRLESPIEDLSKESQSDSGINTSLFSLYKSSGIGVYTSDLNNDKRPFEEKKQIVIKSGMAVTSSQAREAPIPTQPKSVDFTRYASSTWKVSGTSQNIPDVSKSWKSVTFTSDADDIELTGMVLDPTAEEPPPVSNKDRSISTRKPLNEETRQDSHDDMDLWLALLAADMGVSRRSSDNITSPEHSKNTKTANVDDTSIILHEMLFYKAIKAPFDTMTTNLKDDYEEMHRNLPGFFRDTVTMDDPDQAYVKVKNIIKNIVNDQKLLKPMFDIDFAHLQHYPTVEKRLLSYCKQIAPQRMFY